MYKILQMRFSYQNVNKCVKTLNKSTYGKFRDSAAINVYLLVRNFNLVLAMEVLKWFPLEGRKRITPQPRFVKIYQATQK